MRSLLKCAGVVGLLMAAMGTTAVRGQDLGVHVRVDVFNAAMAPENARGAYCFPVCIRAVNPLGLSSRSRLYYPFGTNASVVMSNLVWGDFRLEVLGNYVTTTNWFSVPQTNAGTMLNITNLIDQAFICPGSTVPAYSTWSLQAGSNSTFRKVGPVTYVDSQAAGGGGQVTTNGHNVFTGTNTFYDQVEVVDLTVGGIFTADINGEYVLPGTLSSNKLDAGSLAQLALAGTLVGNLDGAKVSAGTLAEAALTTALQAKIDAGGGGGVTNLTNTIIFLSGNANAGRISVTNRNVEGGEQGTDRMTNSPVLLVDNLGNTTGDYSGQNVGEVLFKDILGGFGQLFYLPQHGPTVAANGASSQLKLLSSGGLCIMTIMNWSAGASTNMPGNANRELQWGLGGYGQPYSRFQSSQVFHGWTGADTNNSDAMFPMFFQAITYTNAPGSPGVSTFAGSDTNGYQLPALTFSGYGTNGAGVLTFWDNLDTEITASEQWNNMGTTARKRLQIITGPVEADRGIAIYGGIKINGAVGLTTNYTLVSGDTMSFSNGVLVAITPPAAYTWDASVLSYMTISQGGTNTYATNTGFAGYVGSWFEATNLNAWIKAQKAHGTWTYCDAIYPLTGPYPSNAVYNLRTNSWNITWAGTPTCSATGMVFNGSSQAGDTHYIPTSAATISGMGLTNGHIMLYVESFTVQAPFDFLTGNGGTYYDKLFIAGDSTTMQGQLHNLSSLTTLSVPSEKRGPWLVDCVPGEGNVTLYNYATSYSNALSGTPHLDDVSTAIGARGLGGSSFDHWAKCTLAGAQLGAGIPAALVPQMLADWNAFQQVMGRKVP